LWNDNDHVGVERGFYARVSRLGTQWLELDLHFLSLGGGEIALGWWFEECLVPYLINTSKLEAVQSISIVTGYGKTRSRGARMNDDGMRLRVRAMLKYMDIHETPQPNKGRIHIDKSALIEVVKINGGRIKFDLEGYTRFKEEETTANKFPDVVQQVRPRFRPARPGQGPAGTFIRDGDPVPPYRPPDDQRRDSDYQDDRRSSFSRNSRDDRFPERGPDSGRPSGDDRMHDRSSSNYSRNGESSRNQDQRRGDDWRGGPRDAQRRGTAFGDQEGHGNRGYRGDRPDNGIDRRGSQRGYNDGRPGIGNESDRRSERQPEFDDRRGSSRNWDGHGRDSTRSNRDYDPNARGPVEMDRRRGDERDGRSSVTRPEQSSYHYSDDRRLSMESRGNARSSRGPPGQTMRFSDRHSDRGSRAGGGPNGGGRHGPNEFPADFRAIRNDPEVQDVYCNEETESPAARKRPYDEYQKQQPPSRGYDIEPTYAKRRSS